MDGEIEGKIKGRNAGGWRARKQEGGRRVCGRGRGRAVRKKEGGFEREREGEKELVEEGL